MALPKALPGILPRSAHTKKVSVNGVQLSVTDVPQRIPSLVPTYPIVFIHGVWTSKTFFQNQIIPCSELHRVITFDLRGHGNSEKTTSGIDVATFAQDLQALLQKLSVNRPVLVGWSMGAMVIWEYLKQWTNDPDVMAQNVAGAVFVDQAPSDFKWPGYDYGVFTGADLSGAVMATLTDQAGIASFLVAEMLELADPNDPSSYNQATFDWMLEEVLKVPKNIAATILVDQTLRDYRDFLPNIVIPTSLIFADDQKLTDPDAGPYMEGLIPGSVLNTFQDSAHAFFYEQASKFNQALLSFVEGLSPAVAA